MAPPDRIYLDNAATSWPKPETVYAAVDRYQRELGAPAGRSGYREAAEVERLIADARRQVAQLVGAEDPKQIIFTSGGTDSLNLALHGIIQPGDHVITSVVEHNSVLRPLRRLEETYRVEVTRVDCGGDGLIDPDAVRQEIRSNTRMIVMIFASNVTGAIQPVAEIGRIARSAEVLFAVDAAQALGHVPFHVNQIQVDLLAAPGHKGLLGPLGTGVLYVAPGVENRLQATRQGGTGTQSEIDRQPQTLPDGYESGSANVPGIVGLGEGAAYVRQRTLQDIRRHEMELASRLLEGLKAIDGVTVHGPGDPERQAGVVSIAVAGYDPHEVASTLDAAYSIQVRSGLHCAPLMHRALGTADHGGTARFSVGPFTTPDHIDAAVRAVAEIASAAVGSKNA